MKKTDLDARNSTDVNYTERLVEAQSAQTERKSKPVCPEGMSREDWIASMQAPSTKAIIQRDPTKDETHFNRVLDAKQAQVQTSGADVVSAAEQRLASYGMKQISHIENIRRRPKNSLGQSIESATTPERRESAIHHFEVSGRAIIPKGEESRVVKELHVTDSVLADSIKEVWVPMTFWQAVRHWLKGNKVVRRPEDNNRWGMWEIE